MKSRWKQYLLYASLIIVGGVLAFLLIETVRAKNTGFEAKTLWDWMQLLIIPLFLTGAAVSLNRSEKEKERLLAEDRAKLEREIATDRQQEAALQAYIDRMSELLLKEKLRTTQIAEVRDVARTRTISVMRGLDTRRINLVIQFLREANLITGENSILKSATMDGMNLQDVDLRNANLQSVSLRNVNLQGAYLSEANLEGANLEDANLKGANSSKVNLRGVDLSGVELRETILYEPNFESAVLANANLQDAIFYQANLQGVNLVGANLQDAYFLQANLRGALFHVPESANLFPANLQGVVLDDALLLDARVGRAQLAQAKSLKGATMPDGTKHE